MIRILVLVFQLNCSIIDSCGSPYSRELLASISNMSRRMPESLYYSASHVLLLG